MKKKKIICFIPARLKSSRFPNKMILKLKGKRIINLVYDICKKNSLFDDVYVATCDQIIENISKKNNAKVINTSSKHQDCISRVVEAVKKIGNQIKSNDYILIVQGDEVCISNKILNDFCKTIKKKESDYFNLLSKINLKKDLISDSIIKCAINKNDEIIFMTRCGIPYEKNFKLKKIETYRQTGVIAFTKKKLLNFSRLKKNYLEKYESIDMLRIIENGYKIKAYKVKKRMIGVDTPKDYREVKKILN